MITFRVHLKPGFRPPAAQPQRFWPLRPFTLKTELAGLETTGWVLEVYWQRLLLSAAVFGVLFYLLAVTGLWYSLSRNPHNRARWSDVAVAPWDRTELRRKLGDAAILTGLDNLRDKNYPEAFYNLRVGLARSPANTRGRLMLVRLIAGQNPAQALSLLEDGLAHSANDLAYLQALFGYYSHFQAGTRALQQLDRLLSPAQQPALTPASRAALAAMRSTLLLGQDQTEAAAQSLAAADATTATEAAAARHVERLKIALLAKQGRKDDARLAAARYFSQTPHAAPELRAEGELAVAVGDAEALRVVLLHLKAAAPADPATYLYAYQAWQRLDRPAQREAAEREFFGLFFRNEAALQAFAALGVALDQPELIQRVQRVAGANRFSVFAYHVHLTELDLRHGDFEAAVRRLRDWEITSETLQPAQRFYPGVISRLARAALTGTPQAAQQLLEHLTAARGAAQPALYALVIDVLERAAQPGLALQVAQAGLRLYPYADRLIAAHTRLQEDAARLAAKAEAARPAAGVALPETAADALKQVESALAADHLVQARDLLRAVRSRPAEWQRGSEAGFDLREVELALLAQDLVTARTVVRGFLGRHPEPADLLPLVALAESLLARGHAAEARLVHDEVAALPALPAPVIFALKQLNLPDDLAVYSASAAAATEALTRWIAAQQFTQAERLLKHVRQQSPEWLAGAQDALAVAEIQLRFGLDQRPLALAALKDLVVRSGAPRSAAFRLVRELVARGERDQALILAKEIVRLLPDDKAAAKLLKEAEAPRPAGEGP